ncbi:ABC transporter permease [Clostridium disporicum]|uniref:ABC transporter permease n=1 Tax=Clostridium disporicum TaxID=84024 RepID=A0A174G020_9CLOT|nr:ABC transporter permease [Clostridium disporicum]MDY3361718.1 ABC transporter permease [Clostridium celatum]CUO55892.1 ABC transporter permease [Clostridium disporicum]
MVKKIFNFKIVKFLKESPKTAVGLALILIVLILTLGADLFTPYEPMQTFDGLWRVAPSADHILGTTQAGKDVWAQTLYGGRVSISVGIFAGSIAVVLSLIVGITAGYFGGVVDNIITTIINVIMVIPQTVLLLIIASMIGVISPMAIGVIIGLTSWPWGARVYRAQTMSLRNREFVKSAETLGESKLRILFVEIMPNMLSMITSGFIGTIIYAIMAQSFIEFIGFGDRMSVTWGQMLNNAQSTGALSSGVWWEILGPSVFVILFGAGLTLINFSIDEVSNPKLRAQRIMRKYYKEKKKQEKLLNKQLSATTTSKGGIKYGSST